MSGMIGRDPEDGLDTDRERTVSSPRRCGVGSAEKALNEELLESDD
jgi:hypothetical protein